MMTWPEWLQLWKISAQEMAHGARPPRMAAVPVSAELAAGFLREDAARRSEVDRACGYWAEFCEWPDMTPETKWFAMNRVLNAAETAIAFCSPYQGAAALVPAEHMDDEAMREWFLIDLWDRTRTQWAERIGRSVVSWGTPQDGNGAN